MNLELRPEKSSEYFETEKMTREAFWNQYVPGCMEHYLLHVMRKCPEFIPELDIVAVDDEKIIGDVVCVKSHIEGDDGRKYEVLTLGPIAVLPEYQRKGVGAKLIEYAKKKAGEMGFRAIILCGDPDYYTRNGFVSAETFGIRTADNMYMAALHACELYENALSGLNGRYYEGKIYNIDEKMVAEYDKIFPVKEAIKGTPSQKRFEMMCTMMRRAD